MKNEGPPAVDYEGRQERQTVGEWWAKAPRRFTLLAGLICNWAVFFVVSLLLGGVAIGTTPSTQGYVVTSHEHFTHVANGVWLFSLLYSSIALIVTPLAFLLVLASLVRGLFDGRRVVVRFALFMFLILAPWTYVILRDTCRSALDFVQMSGMWSAIAWLLRGATVIVFASLVIGGLRENRRDREQWLSRWGERFNAVVPQIRRK